MSHPMFALSGTEAAHRFRGSLRGESSAIDARRKSMLSRAVRDVDGAHQSSRRTLQLRSAHPPHRADYEAPFGALDLPRQLSSTAIAHRHTALGAAAASSADDFGVWDQDTLDRKLEQIHNLTRRHTQLLGKAAATIPEGHNGSSHETAWMPEAAFVETERGSPRWVASRSQQRAFQAHITVLDQIDAVALQAHRCVVEMRQRIEELALMQRPSPPGHAARRSDGALVDGPPNESSAPRRENAAWQQLNAASTGAPVMRPHVPRLDDAALRRSPLKNRVTSGRPAAGSHRGLALWDGVPPLHACFVAIADGDWSHLLTVQQVKKEDVRAKCISLIRFTAFLRHCKAFTKLATSQKTFEQAFGLALRCGGCAFDENRLNFYGFCQVMLNVTRLIGVLRGSGGELVAADCTPATCAAVSRLLLLLVPQFAMPGSRTARNYERNAWAALQPSSGPARTAAPHTDPTAHDARSDDSPPPAAADACVEQQQEQLGSQLPPPREDRAPAEATADGPQGAASGSGAALTFRLRFSCRQLLDCDIFSKSDPYVIVLEVAAGGHRRDAAELGRTEVIQDNLDPVFVTRVAVVSQPSVAQVCGARFRFEVFARVMRQQELLFQVFDEDDAADDFLGEATMLLDSAPRHSR